MEIANAILLIENEASNRLILDGFQFSLHSFLRFCESSVKSDRWNVMCVRVTKFRFIHYFTYERFTRNCWKLFEICGRFNFLTNCE